MEHDTNVPRQVFTNHSKNEPTLFQIANDFKQFQKYFEKPISEITLIMIKDKGLTVKIFYQQHKFVFQMNLRS